MEIGKLRHRVQIMKHAPGQDSVGQPEDTMVEHCKCWADIRNLRGFEAIKAHAQTSTVSSSIRIRYRLDITAGMEVWHTAGGVLTKYNINAVMPDLAQKQRTDLLCEVKL